jgi:hypothetical protein
MDRGCLRGGLWLLAQWVALVPAASCAVLFILFTQINLKNGTPDQLLGLTFGLASNSEKYDDRQDRGSQNGNGHQNENRNRLNGST